MNELGFLIGTICNRNGCKGIIDEYERKGCSCHINPPCSSCTEARAFCPECDWQEKEDYIINDYIVSTNKKTSTETWSLRPLDPMKLDW